MRRYDVIGIVVSRADSASERIGERLLDLADWGERRDDVRPDADGGGSYYRRPGFELRTFDDIHLDLEGVAAAFGDVDLVVFVSRHAGDTGPLLTAHFTGNFGPAEFGGATGELSRACPNAHAAVLAALAEHAPDGYDVGMECTHHGPSEVGAPSMFVELGSDEPQWSDPEAARAVARAVLAIEGEPADRDRQLVGFGGGHYAPRFARIVRETDWAVGHVGADWGLDAMGAPDDHRGVVRQAFERSDAEYAVVDGDHPDVAAVVDDLGYRVVSETWVREVERVPLAFVEAVEDALRPVDDGLRFGDPAASYDGPFEVVDLPVELVDDATGIDADAVRDAVDRHALAFETTENGTRVAGRAALASDAAREAVVDALVAVLREKYESIERTADAVVAREVAFDPAKARELGVDEGPAFGRLSAGEPVDVDGETVRPEQVRTERTHRYPL